jgi:hypothetical protein
VAEAQEDEAVSSSDKAQGPHVNPISPPTQQPSSPASNVSDTSLLLGAQPSYIPSTFGCHTAFFPYYLPNQHPHFPVHHSPWMYHHYQPPQSTQNVPSTAGGSSPPPPRHFPNFYSPMMYPISPVPPLSPQSVGMMSPQLHQYQPFGFGGGLRSAGASSAGSHSPELAGPASGLNKLKPRMRRRKSQMANLNGNSRAGWEDVGDGWIGLSKVQPTATNVDKGSVADERVQGGWGR